MISTTMGKGGEADEVKKGCPFVEATKGIENFEDIIHGSPHGSAQLGVDLLRLGMRGYLQPPSFMYAPIEPTPLLEPWYLSSLVA